MTFEFVTYTDEWFIVPTLAYTKFGEGEKSIEIRWLSFSWGIYWYGEEEPSYDEHCD